MLSKQVESGTAEAGSCGRYWRRIFFINCLATVLVAAGQGAFSGRVSLGQLLETIASAFIFSNSIGGLIGLSLPRVVPHMRVQRFPLNWVLLVVALLVINGAGCLLAMLILVALGMAPLDRVPAEFWNSYRFGVFFTLVFGVAGTLYELVHSQLERTTQALQIKQREEEQSRQTATEARLSSLESRVRPHFLFNTLNSISALVHDHPDEAERLIEHLSALLRSSLDMTDQQTISLSEEMRLVRDYLAIEKTRFGDRVGYTIEVPDSLAGVRVLPFSVQPLVENAVKYAVSPHPGGATIWIEARRDGGRLALSVTDDGPGFAQRNLTPGHGLQTLQARLDVLFGREAGLDIARHDDRTTVTVTMPLRTSEHVFVAK